MNNLKIKILGLVMITILSPALTHSAVAKVKLPPVKEGQPLPSNLFIELAKMINPTVVNISTSTLPSESSDRRSQDPMMEFFKQFMGPNHPYLKRRPTQSLGTGFIIRSDGLIVTNAHVIDKADVIKVQLSEKDKTLYDAEVIGKDRRTDIALIKINAKKKLPTAKLGTSRGVQVGEWVSAFGNPYGHGHTMTKGIVSAIGREIDELNRFPFLQTDASINPGNSGGPLVNVRGEVIGVNTAIDARAQGIGFAIPIDNVKSILPVLEKNGVIKRGFLGIFMENVTPQAKDSLNLNTDSGALVIQVMEDGPAQKGGIKPYDVIVNIDGRKIENTRDLARTIQDSPVGSKKNIRVLRDGKKKNLKVKLTEHPDDKVSLVPKSKSYSGQKAPFELGFKVTNYDSTLAKRWGLPNEAKGKPVIIDVTLGSPASLAGLSPGDVILDINKRPVRKSKDVLRRLKKKSNMMRVLKPGQRVVLVYIKPE